MSTVVPTDVAAAISAARMPVQRVEMPSANLRTRLKTSPSLYRAVPPGLLLRRGETKARRLWRNGPARDHALAATEKIVAGTSRAGEIPALARRRLIEHEANNALFWRPWRISELDAGSEAALEDALASGRRLMLSVCHLGPYFLQISPLSARGVSPVVLAGQWFFDTPEPGYWGRRLARWREGARGRGERLVPTTAGFAALRGLIEAGEVLGIYFDLPGSVRTDFLGKPVMLASGTCQLAHQTGALVLPLRARRVGLRAVTDVWQAIDARDHASPEELHRAIAAVHERSILEMPEALEDPGRAGAWEDGASALEWARRAQD
jgi:hypothetical protein